MSRIGLPKNKEELTHIIAQLIKAYQSQFGETLDMADVQAVLDGQLKELKTNFLINRLNDLHASEIHTLSSIIKPVEETPVSVKPKKTR